MEDETMVDFPVMWQEYLTTASTKMMMFEVSRQCGENGLILVYKQETLEHLYNKIRYHFNTHFLKISMTVNNTEYNLTPTAESIWSYFNRVIFRHYPDFRPDYSSRYQLIYKINLHDNCNCCFCSMQNPEENEFLLHDTSL